MIGGKRCLGVIPAREGSKRIPGKNIKELCGKPLIQWSIDSGNKSKYIDRLIVSTDSHKIAKISKFCGADVPFIRPANLAKDSSGSFEVLEHAYKFLHDQGDYYDYIIMLQPTSPLRTDRHIDEAIELLDEKHADGVISLSEITHPIEWCGVLPETMEMDKFIDNIIINSRSQQFEKRFCLNGAIYLTSIQRMQSERSHIYGNKMYAYIMEPYDSVDIDNPIDMEIAEFLLLKRQFLL